MSEAQNPSAGPTIINNIPAQQQPQANGQPVDVIGQMSRKDFENQLAEAEARGARRTIKALGIDKDQRDNVLAKVRSGEFVLAPKPKAGDVDYKTEYEKLKPAATELEQLKTRATQDEAFFKKVADDAFAALPEPAQKYIAAKAGEDPRGRLNEINMLKESGMLTVGSVVADAKAAAAKAGEAKPATTMASPGPTSPKSEGEKNAYERYLDIEKNQGKIMAAHHYRANRHAIEAARPQK